MSALLCQYRPFPIIELLSVRQINFSSLAGWTSILNWPNEATQNHNLTRYVGTTINMATKQRSVCHRAQGIPPLKVSTGKRQGGPTVVSTTAGPPDPQLIITDSITRRHFLVDTGAQVSVIPPTWHERHFGQRGQALQAANGTTISTFGSRDVKLHCDIRTG
ncbi:retrovirus-related pol polyprotein [Plakobranchus ocellatus]|uniref:Retrovirus-related pol polyprotein n=1 Tax=Plakobranchus ocellatus TaxID=259542 RepID=A0AAV4CPC1_9GAST|nr:retrovirus-related pol polyprotein [Plakobranchus ocellatus]